MKPKKKIYIAGKVSGEPIAECTMKFGQAQKQVEALGFMAINPLALVGDWNATWREAMNNCIKVLVECDGVLLLPDYLESRGAIVERDLAMGLDIPTFHDLKKFTDLWKSN